jgi:hypothetical protein
MSVVNTKLGSRTEWIRLPATSAPRASTGPSNRDSGTADCGMRTSARLGALYRKETAAVDCDTGGPSWDYHLGI